MAEGTGARRRYSRVPWSAQATIAAGGREASGAVLDISLNGVLLGTDPSLGLGAPCEIRIPLGEAPGQVITASGRVARRGEGVLAVRLETMDLDSAAHLRRLVTLNSADPAQADREAAHLRLPQDQPPPTDPQD